MALPFPTETNHLLLAAGRWNLWGQGGCLRLGGTPLSELNPVAVAGGGGGAAGGLGGGGGGVSVVRVPLGAGGVRSSSLSCSPSACGGVSTTTTTTTTNNTTGAGESEAACRPFWGYVQGVRDTLVRGWALPLGTFRRRTSRVKRPSCFIICLSFFLPRGAGPCRSGPSGGRPRG